MNKLLHDLLSDDSRSGKKKLQSGSDKAVAWARVSTGKQEKRQLSIPQQLSDIRCVAEKQGFEIVQEFSEAASAFRRQDKRFEFHRMIAWVRAHPEVRTIFVHDMSRFHRDSVEGKALKRKLNAEGTRVISLNDPEIDLETAAGVYMEAITFAKNEAYSREVAFHTRKGCRANVQKRDPMTGWCYKNGGQPLWGYRFHRLTMGEEPGGRAIVKSTWVLDETIVSDRPVHEWVRHCLLELAAKGASLAELRDFCNSNGLPARRTEHWGLSTWNALLRPSVLLQYCGFAVWGVHTKSGQERDPSEWVIVENAHPAIISQDEVRLIAAARRSKRQTKQFDAGYGRSRTSSYLLSGGSFRCGRCGANMIGFRKDKEHSYYVCGSQPYRRGMGCGPGVYVPQQQIEAEVFDGLREVLGVCADPKGFTRRVNEELRRLSESSAGFDPFAAQKIRAIERKTANLRQAIEDGLIDTHWANSRLRELLAERNALEAAGSASGRSPQIDAETALRYRRETEKLFRQGAPAERKRLLRTWVKEITLDPERLEVTLNFRVPDAVVNGLVAGGGFEPPTFGL